METDGWCASASWVVDAKNDELPVVVPPVPAPDDGERSIADSFPVAVLRRRDYENERATYWEAAEVAAAEEALGMFVGGRGAHRAGAGGDDMAAVDSDNDYDPPLAVPSAGQFRRFCTRHNLRSRPVGVAVGGELHSFAWVGTDHVLVTPFDPHTGRAGALAGDTDRPGLDAPDGAALLGGGYGLGRCRVYEQPVSDADADALAADLAALAL